MCAIQLLLQPMLFFFVLILRIFGKSSTISGKPVPASGLCKHVGSLMYASIIRTRFDNLVADVDRALACP